MTTEYGTVETTEMNKNIVRRFIEEFEIPCDLDHANELISYGLVQHSSFPMGQGLAGLRKFMSSLSAAFPDLDLQIEQMIAEDDKVVAFINVTGTNRGQFMNRSPTGKKVEFKRIDIYRLDRGKIVEHWDVVDRLSIYEQLGWSKIPEE